MGFIFLVEIQFQLAAHMGVQYNDRDKFSHDHVFLLNEIMTILTLPK